MNTLGHAVLNLAVLDKKGRRWPKFPIIAGSILPDIPIFLFYFYQKFFAKVSEQIIWSDIYFRREWQNLFDTFHSIPFSLAGLLLAFRFKNRWLQAFFAGFCMHSVVDLPLHNDDAHAHFFPFTDYRFVSPVSYWDPNHFGWAITLSETLLVFGLSIFIWRKLEARWTKILLLTVNLLYILSGLMYFNYVIG